MITFPIMLDIRGRRVVVVGGGQVGLRKARGLAQAKAQVVLVTEELCEEEGLDGVTVVRQSYRKEFLDGAFLVFACTDDRGVNARVARDARLAGAMVNAADQPEDCDFLMPAILTDGEVVVAVSTGGSAPALAANLRDWLAEAFPAGVGEFAKAIGELREKLRVRLPQPRQRAEIVQALCTREMLDAFRAEGVVALERKCAELLGERVGGNPQAAED